MYVYTQYTTLHQQHINTRCRSSSNSIIIVNYNYNNNNSKIVIN